MNTRSLRVRLAVWYFCSVAAICSLAAGGYWLAVRAALESALDEGLRYRLAGLRQYLEDADGRQQRDVLSRFAEIAPFGELYKLFDGDGTLIMQSDSINRHQAQQRPPADLGAEIRYETGGTDDFPLRIAWQRVTIGGRPLILAAVDPQRKYEGVLDTFTWVPALSMPLILLAATLCGWWLGRRALAPVARIVEETRAITERNLSTRLAVPDSGDELQQLSETLNAMLARIEESVARIRQFTADASHELRAPMTLIHTAAEFSLRRERSREDLLESMEQILREAERTTTLIDDLLVLARGDAGTEAPVMRTIDAEPLLRDVADQARALAAGKDLDVQCHVDTRPLSVNADDESLRRLLLVLVHNAVKFTPSGGVVTVAGRQDATHVVLTVTDTGVGIAPADQPRVFQRFWRADTVRTRKAGGTGLGLSIASQIAAEHRASLHVESEVGRGSCFTVRLPRAG